jgi:hypothetical protein
LKGKLIAINIGASLPMANDGEVCLVELRAIRLSWGFDLKMLKIMGHLNFLNFNVFFNLLIMIMIKLINLSFYL